MLIIDDRFSINSDGNGVTLNYKEEKEVTNLDTLESKIVTQKASWHFLSVPQALNKYKDLVLNPCEDLAAVLEKLIEVENLIKTFK
jgi:hypothetical protein